MTFLANIKQQALFQAFSHHLSETPAADKFDATLEAMENDDVEAFRRLGVVVWHVYENEPLPDLAVAISNAADLHEFELLKAVELYKQSVTSEDVANTISALTSGIEADIWFDADACSSDPDMESLWKSVQETQSGMRKAIELLSNFSVLTQKDIVVGPWDCKHYSTSEDEKPLKHTIRLADQRVSNGQLYIDVKDNDLNENVLSVTVEIDSKGQPTAILHFDDNQVAAVFRKVGDRDFSMDPETGIQVTRVAHGQYHLTGETE